MRLWLLFCADLAIRSGTAARLAPHQYNPEQRTLSFVTKWGEHLTLPTTAEIDALIARCDLTDPRPFCIQLRAVRYGPTPTDVDRYSERFRIRFNRLKLAVGIRRRIVAHDLRRTAAVRLYQTTRDVRAVQALLGHQALTSTLWYLDHETTPVSRALLEEIKRADWSQEHTA